MLNILIDLVPDGEMGESGTPPETRPVSGCSGRCPGFILNSNYDQESTNTEDMDHAVLYPILWYFHRGDEFRQLVIDDSAVGDALLSQKYEWVKTNIFRGVEFGDDLLPR